MQNILRRDSFASDAAFGECYVFRNFWVEMVANHQHVEVFIHCIDCEGPGRVGRGRQHIRLTAYFDNIRRMTAASTFGMEGMDVAALESSDRVLDEAGLVQGIGVDRHRDVGVLRNRQAIVNRSRCRAPILVQF